MRFVFGLLAALFAVSAVPASAARMITYTATGSGSAVYGAYSPYANLISSAVDVVVTVTVNADAPIPFCSFDMRPDVICYASIYEKQVLASFWNSTSGGYTDAYITLNFNGTDGDALTGTGFSGGGLGGTALNAIFNVTLRTLQVTSFEGSGVGSVSIGYTPFVPEPATWGMMIAGLAIVGAAMRRRTMIAING